MWILATVVSRHIRYYASDAALTSGGMQHLIIDIVRAADAFVHLEAGSALEYYLNLSNPLQAAKTAVYVTLTLVGDGFVVSTEA